MEIKSPTIAVAGLLLFMGTKKDANAPKVLCA